MRAPVRRFLSPWNYADSNKVKYCFARAARDGDAEISGLTCSSNPEASSGRLAAGRMLREEYIPSGRPGCTSGGEGVRWSLEARSRVNASLNWPLLTSARAESVGSLIAVFTASSNYWVNTKNPRVNTSFFPPFPVAEGKQVPACRLRVNDAGVARGVSRLVWHGSETQHGHL